MFGRPVVANQSGFHRHEVGGEHKFRTLTVRRNAAWREFQKKQPTMSFYPLNTDSSGHPNAVKGFGLETMRYGQRLPPTVGVRSSHHVVLSDSHGREPVG